MYITHTKSNITPFYHLGFLDGYTFHGDPYKVFEDFFGCDNPFKGAPECLLLASVDVVCILYSKRII